MMRLVTGCAAVAALGVLALAPSVAGGESTVTTTTTPTGAGTTPPPGSPKRPADAIDPPAGRSASSTPAATECLPPKSGGKAPADATSVDPPVTLEASPAAATVNFGASRDPKDVVFKLTTQTPLDSRVASRLEVVADPIARAGASTDSAVFPEPTFSEIRRSQNGKTISFRVCLDPDPDPPASTDPDSDAGADPPAVKAGQYVGTITVEGPPGIESTPMTLTANAKDGCLFWIAAGLSLLFAFFILLYKGATDERVLKADEEEKARSAALADANALTDPAEKEAAIKSAEELRSREDLLKDLGEFWKAAGRTVVDPKWLVGTVFAIGAAFGALWGIYYANPAWGEAGPVTSAFAIIGAALAAVGAKAIVSSAK